MPSFNSISTGMKILHALIDACLHTRDTVFTSREKDNHITLPSTRTVVTTGQSHGSSNHQDRHPGELSSPRPRDAQICVIIASDTGLSACPLFGVKLLSEPMLDYFNLTLGNESRWKWNQDTLENIREMADTILSRPQYVNASVGDWKVQVLSRRIMNS